MQITNLSELIGQRVVVVALHSTRGFLIVEKHLSNRRIGATGTVGGWVPGHGGDVVWVKHEHVEPGEDPTSVYCHYSGELEFFSDDAVAFAEQKLKVLMVLKEGLKEATMLVENERARPFNANQEKP